MPARTQSRSSSSSFGLERAKRTPARGGGEKKKEGEKIPRGGVRLSSLPENSQPGRKREKEEKKARGGRKSFYSEGKKS